MSSTAAEAPATVELLPCCTTALAHVAERPHNRAPSCLRRADGLNGQCIFGLECVTPPETPRGRGLHRARGCIADGETVVALVAVVACELVWCCRSMGQWVHVASCMHSVMHVALASCPLLQQTELSSTTVCVHSNTQATHHMPVVTVGSKYPVAGTHRPAKSTCRHPLQQTQSTLHHPEHMKPAHSHTGTFRHVIKRQEHPCTQAWTRSPPSRQPNVSDSGACMAAPTAAAPGPLTPSTTPRQLQRNTQAPHLMTRARLCPSMDPQST
jgi:hypothetical protein